MHALELCGLIASWDAMHTTVCAPFDKDQYQLLLRQLENLRQTGSVSDYIARFEQLTHSVLLYNQSYDDVFLVTRFLTGLRDEIRAPVALHRPSNVDIASALALLQEQEMESHSRLAPWKSESRDFVK